MRSFVAFRGIAEPAEAEAVPEGAAAGLIVGAEPSPRSLSLEAAVSLAEHVRPGAEIWAVTEAPTSAFIRRIFDELGVDRIEVVGAVPDDLEFLEAHHVIPAIVLAPSAPDGPPVSLPPPERHPILHLVGPGASLRSGTFTAPDLEATRSVVDRQPGRKMLVSCGPSEEELVGLLAGVRPWGVELGLEPGPSGSGADRVRELAERVARLEGGSP